MTSEDTPPDAAQSPGGEYPSSDYFNMRCMDCGYPLGGLKSRACPECGRPFDPEDRRTFRQALDQPKDLHTTRSPAEAHLIRHELEAAGLPALVRDAITVMWGFGGYTVCVEEIDLPEGKEIVREFLERQERQRAGPVGASWTCSACGESNTPAFEICWNCQTPCPLPDDAKDE